MKTVSKELKFMKFSFVTTFTITEGLNPVLSLFSKLPIQLWPLAYKRLLNEPYVNEVTLTLAKPSLKILLGSWTFDTVKGDFRSFDAKNLGYVCQRALKLSAVKLQEWFDPGCTWTWAELACIHLGWNGRSGRLFLEISNFDN